MKQYSHNYTLVQHADNLLQEALVKIKWDNFWDARIRIEDARKKLQQYLSQDNMVEDDDTADGWVRASDVDRFIVEAMIRTKDVKIRKVETSP